MIKRTDKLTTLGRMAAGIAHRINNPLAGILLYSSILKKQVAEEGPFQEGLEIIIQETLRCKRVIQEFLDFSEERPPLKKPADFNSVLEMSLGFLENEFRLHYIQLEKSLSPELPEVLLDINQIQQVFINILKNAIEATLERGRIKVSSRVSPDGRTVKAEIFDNGCGIEAEDLDKVFEPFFSNKQIGTGLGLSVCLRIIENHQGQLEVSSHPRIGTCFSVILPVYPKLGRIKNLDRVRVVVK